MELGKTKIDPNAVSEGVWTEFVLPGGQEISLRLSLMNAGQNARYKEALRTALDPYESLLVRYQGKDLPKKVEAEVKEVLRRLFCEQIVTDWKGPSKNGNPVQYTVDGGIALFAEFPELYEHAEEEAKKFSRYRVAVLEAASGN